MKIDNAKGRYRPSDLYADLFFMLHALILPREAFDSPETLGNPMTKPSASAGTATLSKTSRVISYVVDNYHSD
jgi:hypothetical protein